MGNMHESKHMSTTGKHKKKIARYNSVLQGYAIKISKIKMEQPASTLSVPDVYLSGWQCKQE